MTRTSFRDLNREIGEAVEGGSPTRISQSAKTRALEAYSNAVHSISKPKPAGCSKYLAVAILATPTLIYFGVEGVKQWLR